MKRTRLKHRGTLTTQSNYSSFYPAYSMTLALTNTPMHPYYKINVTLKTEIELKIGRTSCHDE